MNSLDRLFTRLIELIDNTPLTKADRDSIKNAAFALFNAQQPQVSSFAPGKPMEPTKTDEE
jgi:hypothetical protein